MRLQSVAHLLLLFNSAVSRDDESPFLEPTYTSSNAEYYDMESIRYGIFLDRVNFVEAKQICSSWNGSLLELRDNVVGEFIAQALSESAVGTISLWIGGEYTPASLTTPGVWRWLSGDKIMNDPIPDGYHFPMTEPPYWVDRPDLNSSEPACLVTDRCMHRRPLITGLPCTVKRPFICALAAIEVETTPVETATPILSGNKTFHIFHAQYTWPEALSYCRHIGYKLAVVSRPEEFTQLQSRMKRHRPVMENAWIGGAFVEDKWMWVSTNDEIATRNATVGGFSPPWYRPDVTMGGCLLADRHLCDYFAYVEAKCDRKRNFMCESVEEVAEKTTLTKVPSSKLFISTIKLGWQEAQDMCSFCLDGGSLLQLELRNLTSLTLEVKWLFEAMTVMVETEIRHVWLNGYLYGDEFTWGKNKSNPIENRRVDLGPVSAGGSILNDRGDDGLIVFCPGNFTTDPNLRRYKCLNMDRENQMSFFMYGLECDYRQHFVCMTREERPDDLPLPPACRQPETFARWKRRTTQGSTTNSDTGELESEYKTNKIQTAVTATK